MQLSKNFTLSELTFSQTASRKGFDNTPNQKVIYNLHKLCLEILQPARDALGRLRITSGYRSPELNLAIGGAVNSHHLYGHAADVVPLECSKKDLATWLFRNTNFDQLILEFGTDTDPSWIHISNYPTKRKQLLRINRGGTRVLNGI